MLQKQSEWAVLRCGKNGDAEYRTQDAGGVAFKSGYVRRGYRGVYKYNRALAVVIAR